jgi:hypothetical protein
MPDSSFYKIPKLWFPQRNGRTVMFMNTRGWNNAETYDPLEAALSAPSDDALDPDAIMTGGTRNKCYSATSLAGYKADSSNRMLNFGTLKTTIEDDECLWSLELYDNIPGKATGMWSTGMIPQYYDVNLNPVTDESKVPQKLKDKKFAEKTSWSTYDGIGSPPAGGCAATPGPVTDDLYCAQTKTPSWVAYKWYKFVDQPAIQMSALTENERDYLQKRVEKLHRMLAADFNKGNWMKRGAAEEEIIVGIEATLLVTPPPGMEFGYVPVPLYEGVNKPSGCIIATEAPTKAPSPTPPSGGGGATSAPSPTPGGGGSDAETTKAPTVVVGEQDGEEDDEEKSDWMSKIESKIDNLSMKELRVAAIGGGIIFLVLLGCCCACCQRLCCAKEKEEKRRGGGRGGGGRGGVQHGGLRNNPNNGENDYL